MLFRSTYSHDHKVRVVEPEHTKYELTGLQDNESGKLFITLLDKNGELREDMSVTREHVVKYLEDHFKTDNADPLTVFVTKAFVDKLHRVDKEVSLEKITRIEGVDMKHLYDKHHGHHKDKTNKHVK